MGHLGAGNTHPAGTGYIFNFAVWSRPRGSVVYVHPRGGPLKSFKLSQDQLSFSQLSHRSVTTATARLGMTLSADGSDDASGILWLITAGSDGSGTLHAFDASALSVELWNSDMNASRDALGAHAKFVSPTVVNGRVYVPTFSNAVIVYGLLSEAYHQPPRVTNSCARPVYSTGTLEASGVSDHNRGCGLDSGSDSYLK